MAANVMASKDREEAFVTFFFLGKKSTVRVFTAEWSYLCNRSKAHIVFVRLLMNTAAVLQEECNTNLCEYAVCDNIELDTILLEYESYYFVKFQKYPKITKKLSVCSENERLSSKYRENVPKSSAYRSKRPSKVISCQPGLKFCQKVPGEQRQGYSTTGCTQDTLVKIRSMIGGAVRQASGEASANNFSCDLNPRVRLLKPVGAYPGMAGEMQELASVIVKDIYLQNPSVCWDDIIGLSTAKRLVKEAVIYPMKYPQLFTGILSPWKGLLLYGPPGTGKTLLAKAVATECNTTFFNISASTIVSKWRGDSEKLVRVLFELARFHAPSTIFLDELESIMGQRGTVPGGEHEGSRRMKAELLVQMDGLAHSDDLVFVLAASNMPWELDHAMLRRLEKRVLVDLPNMEARQEMIRHHLPANNSMAGIQLQTSLDYEKLAQQTEGYSGSDIHVVCKEAAMQSARKIFIILDKMKPGENLHNVTLDTLTTEDLMQVIAHTKPSAKCLAKRYTAWQQEFESA